MDVKEDVSLKDVVRKIRSGFRYLVSKIIFIFFIGVVFSLVGILYAWYQSPLYTAELTFTSENESSGSISAYAGIAAQFGFDLGGSSGSAFEGENLMHLMSSRRLIEKTLFTKVAVGDSNFLLINYYLTLLNKSGSKNLEGAPILFTSETQTTSRARDSVLKKICFDVRNSLEIKKTDKKSDIISVIYKGTEELFSKIFVEELVNNVINYYIDYKVKKTRQNVSILQRQTDSVRNLINGNIVDIAISNDLNVNPTRQIVRTGIQRKQVDAQVNGALYTELVKNLELSKLALRKETPLIQIIDTPMLPLEKKKMGRLKGAIIFGLIGCFLATVYFTVKKIIS